MLRSAMYIMNLLFVLVLELAHVKMLVSCKVRNPKVHCSFTLMDWKWIQK